MSETLTVPEPTDKSDEYRTAVKAFADYFEPHKCVDHLVCIFRQEWQKSGENITEFYTRLQLLARKCEFANNDLQVKRQIIQGISSVLQVSQKFLLFMFFLYVDIYFACRYLFLFTKIPIYFSLHADISPCISYLVV